MVSLQKIQETLAQRHNVRAHFWQSLANYCQQFSGLVLGVLLARVLSPEIFGEFTYASAVVALFLLPGTWSLSAQVVSEVESYPGIVSDALWVSRNIMLARGALGMAACTYLALTGGMRSALLGGLIALPLVGSEFVAVLRATYEGRGQFKVNFIDSLITAGSTALLSLPAALMGAGVWALALPGIPLFAAQLCLYTKYGNLSLAPVSPRSERSYFRSGSTLWVASMCEGILFRSDKFMLGKFSSLGSLGDYNRAFNYAPMSARVMNSLLTNPTVAGLARAGDDKARTRLIAKSTALLLVGGIVNFALLWWFSGSLVPWIFGEQWKSAIPVFQAMAPLSLVMSFAYLPTAMALANRSYTLLATARIISVAAFLVCAIWIGERMDAPTMAWLLQGALALQGALLMALRFIK